MPDADLRDRATQLVSRRLCDAETPGACVAIVVDGEAAFARGVGSRDLAGRDPLPDDARFYIYSITKMMMAAVALQLVERGVIALDRLVQDYLPAYPLETPITIRQVLNHSSGLPDYGGMPEYAAAVRSNPEGAWTSRGVP